jgi:hypothetical protein
MLCCTRHRRRRCLQQLWVGASRGQWQHQEKWTWKAMLLLQT